MKNRRFLTGMVLFLILMLGAAVQSASAAYSLKYNWARVSGTAGETLEIGDNVCIADADGYVYNADASDSDLRGAVGVIGFGGDSGDTVEIVIYGVMRGYSDLSEGQPVYLAETAGTVTQSAPTWTQQVGVAISATEILYCPQNYFDASSLAALGVLTGASPLVLEGATADDYETTVSPTDPTADNTVTLPDDSGAVAYTPGGGTTVAADALAIPVTYGYVGKTTGADAEALTLANGEDGQILVIDLDTDGGGDGTLSPTTCSGFTSIVFADAGDVATLLYVDDTVGWIIQGLSGVAAPPVTVD